MEWANERERRCPLVYVDGHRTGSGRRLVEQDMYIDTCMSLGGKRLKRLAMPAFMPPYENVRFLGKRRITFRKDCQPARRRSITIYTITTYQHNTPGTDIILHVFTELALCLLLPKRTERKHNFSRSLSLERFIPRWAVYKHRHSLSVPVGGFGCSSRCGSFSSPSP